ncbi:MAG TPA: sigma-70 family RNA polymerase sigma factor [Candidatus Gastranaerophilaceae bacterium]|nr:sigma-70 family RNA polymerase sigma factor [Candidatus Gastranaerophilaceae bacterium]HPT41115.1 sigma-70 family RNA polymerase sigma factor [Candidatus Gastranaerophilaceae bacterium]
MSQHEDTFVQIHEWLLTYRNSKDEKLKKQLKNLIVIAAMPFVKRIACGLARRATDPVDDLIQVGSLGLVKAIDLYNPEISNKFKTYATYLITGEIKHYLRDKASMIKAPREIQELAYRINCVIKQLNEEGFDEPTSEQVAQIMSIPINKIEGIIEVDRRKSTLSLDQSTIYDDEDTALIDKIPSGDYQEFMDSYEKKIMLSGAIKKLEPNLKEIIELSYYDELNQREIAQKLNISQMQVSRRLKRALNRMYNIITKAGK